MTFHEAKRFVEAWAASETLADACAVTGLDQRTLSNRAASFRRMGVALHRMAAHRRRRGPALTADQLARLRNHARYLYRARAAV